MDLHTDKMPRRSSVEEVYEYVRAPINKRLIVYPVIILALLGWLIVYDAFVEDTIPLPREDLVPERRFFSLNFAPAFLDDPLALDMAYQALSQIGYQERKWNPVELADKERVKPPDGSTDVYLHRATLIAGFIMFTNTVTGRELLVAVHVTNNVVSCEVQKLTSKK